MHSKPVPAAVIRELFHPCLTKTSWESIPRQRALQAASALSAHGGTSSHPLPWKNCRVPDAGLVTVAWWRLALTQLSPGLEPSHFYLPTNPPLPAFWASLSPASPLPSPFFSNYWTCYKAILTSGRAGPKMFLCSGTQASDQWGIKSLVPVLASH